MLIQGPFRLELATDFLILACFNHDIRFSHAKIGLDSLLNFEICHFAAFLKAVSDFKYVEYRFYFLFVPSLFCFLSTYLLLFCPHFLEVKTRLS